MLRCVKNANGVIIAIGNDEGQSGSYPDSTSTLGTWCTWTVDPSALPAFSPVAGLDPNINKSAMRFKENATADGIDLRTDAEVTAAPNG